MFNFKTPYIKWFLWLSSSRLIHETLLIPRFWFLYYDWQLGKYLNCIEWKKKMYLGRHFSIGGNESNSIVSAEKQNINASPNTGNERGKWILRHRHMLGSTHIVLGVILIYFGGVFFISGFLRFTQNTFGFAVITAWSVSTTAALVLCGSRIVACQDLLEIQRELKMIVANCIIWPVVGAILLAFLKSPVDFQLWQMITTIGLHCVNVLIMLRPKDLYYRINYKNCRWLCVRSHYVSTYKFFLKHPSLGNEVIDLSPFPLEPANSIHSVEVNAQLSLDNVLADKNGFELFAAHLVKELSLENILFL
ncbi:hypothetical protein RFI_16427, partial [Reticulomyxa filosa]